jgi:3-hydroxyacyl-CoA dehydrogenase/3-hydroxy-2-methylbutyryl-CoA dehydrogenase
MSVQMPQRARKKTLATTEYPARFGRPDEFAHAAVSIIENDMMNGMNLRLDGATRLAKL